MHSGLIQVRSIAFTLAQRHSCTLIFIEQSVTECIQSHSDSLKGIHVHSSALNRIQCSLKGAYAHSECIQPCSTAFNAHSKAFTCTQSAFNRVQSHSTVFKRIQYSLKSIHVHSSTFKHIHARSVVVTLTQRHSVRSDS